MRTSVFSLWLVPERDGPVFRQLREIINTTSREFGTPVFDPHVTLLGGVTGAEQDMRQKTAALARQLAPYELRLGEVASHGTYLQILFSKIEQDTKVMAANAEAQRAFGVNQGTYFPHLSFAYGDMSQDQVKIQQEALEARKIVGTAFLVNGIELWRCEGTVAEWRCIQSFSLPNTRR